MLYIKGWPPMPRAYTPRVEFTCEVCGKTVSRPPSLAAKGQRYCSSACMGVAKQRPATFTCQGCGRIVETNLSGAKRLYCSMQCRKEHKKHEITCEVCGTVKRVTLIQIKQGRRFCSLKCSQKVLNISLRETVTCEQCGKEFSVQRYRTNQGVRFCSHSCRSIFNITHGVMASPTTIELMLYQALDVLGIEYIPQHPMPEAGTVPDAYVPALKLVLYADGDYWHNLPKQAARDVRQDKRLASLGYRVVRLSEADLRRDALGVVRNAVERG
jgi:G:T-mismatch repair DNA endonuclease (very short patch repair protein)/endogenous inhibitor of DNA gyrase (YacG/DUF329 family)